MTFGQKSFTNFQTHNKMEEILKRLEIIEKHVLDQWLLRNRNATNDENNKKDSNIFRKVNLIFKFIFYLS